jgi:cell division protein FtsW
MTDQPIRTPFTEAPPRSMPRVATPVDETRAPGRGLLAIARLDVYLLIVVGGLLAIGMMMVYSTTFDWSFQTRGSESAVFLQHVRNALIGGVFLFLLAWIDYRRWRRFAVVLLLITIASLIAVLLYGDDTFGARRALINGSYQPGELAELVMVIYMAAWLGSKSTKVRSVAYGLIPFAMLVGIVGVLVLLQPDISTAAMIFGVSVVMFFLAGADVIQLAVAGGTAGVVGVVWIMSGRLSYAEDRVLSFLSGTTDLSQTAYQVQQAINAFRNGGWMGVGIGQGRQKFGFLPAPHTDSIFAVIGEELGIIGATFVVLLFVAFAIRGLQIARRSTDPFGALLASGLTIWIVAKALLNIAVMTAVVPPTGAPLPFISFGGSSLVVVMIGVGLLLSVARVAANSPERRKNSANYDRGRGNGRPRISRTGRSRSDDSPIS